MVAMATGHRFSRNPPFNASKGCVKWSKGINYSWETLDFAGLQKKSGNSLSEDQIFSFLASRCNHVLKLVTLFKKRQPDASPVQFSKLVAVADVSSSKQKQISPNRFGKSSFEAITNIRFG